MKPIVIAAGMAIGLMACGNAGDTPEMHTTTDSARHSAHQPSAGTAPSEALHTAGPEASMMDIMHRNIQDMKTVQSIGNPDNDIATLMKVHHRGALDMAQLQIAKGSNPQLKQMAVQKTLVQELSK